MRYIITLLLSFFSITAFAQKEANNWYFGFHAGIKFLDDGSVQILPGSLMETNEGCSTISDPDGNLLFYTDGRTIWDRNHVVMPNADYAGGTGLLGDPSSTLSGIIVPNKNDPDIYYVFTVDEPHHVNADVYPAAFEGIYEDSGGATPQADDGLNNGLNYSIVDLTATSPDGNIGDVVTSNVHLLTYDPAIIDEAKYKCSEKITAVKNSNNTGYWVVAHFIDKFYAFSVDGSGVNATPVVTQITPVVPTAGYRRNAIGCIKASPDGNYIAIAHQQRGTLQGNSSGNGCVYLYDFDNQTGAITNPRLIVTDVNPYGVEFSPQSKKLYVATDGALLQYNLLSANIAASQAFITSSSGTAMQLGPNGKIYKTINGGQSLDVINNPEEDGTLCNYVSGGVMLQSGTAGIFGLPPFITSIFSAAITFEHTCQGAATQFELAANTGFDTVSWNFGDGTPPSTAVAPQHIYAAPGNYGVVASVTRDGETKDVSRQVTIFSQPVANTAPALTICDPDSDGFATFTLSDNDAAVLGTQNAADFTIRYYSSQVDATLNSSASLNAASYTNTANPQTIWARVQNNANAECFALSSFQLLVSDTAALGSSNFALCDDLSDGDNTNGQTTFNLNDVTTQWVHSTGFTTTYYESEADAEVPQNPLPQNYNNVTPNAQTIYGRIVNNTYTGCITILPVTLRVNPLPADVQNAVLVQCDPGFNPDGFSSFNLTEADSQYTNGDAALAVTYFIDDTAAQAGINAMLGPFVNTANPQTISAKVTYTATGCYRILPLTLSVSANSFAAVALEACDDAPEDGLTEFDLTQAGFEAPGTTVVYYPNLDDALMEENAVAAAYTNEVPVQQSVFARIEQNNQCMAIREIILHVRPLPDIETQETEVVCLNTMAFIRLESGITVNTQNYTYLWSTGAATPAITVNQPGTYTVTVTDVTHATLCNKLRTITVIPSNIAHIDNVVVEDLTENNTITLFVSPVGGINTTYTYSLDAPNGPWQQSPYFENVAPGIHTVYVNDVNGCGIVDKDVAVLSIPKYFSPNNDGTNDYWRITGINGVNYNQSKIFIFDRYGKLLSDVKATGPGWDGKHNGNDMPSTDYWFLLHLEDGRTVKGHFSMIR